MTTNLSQSKSGTISRYSQCKKGQYTPDIDRMLPTSLTFEEKLSISGINAYIDNSEKSTPNNFVAKSSMSYYSKQFHLFTLVYDNVRPIIGN